MNTKYLSLPRFFRGKVLSIIEDLIYVKKSPVSVDNVGYRFIKNPSAINFRPGSSVGIFSDSKNKKYIIKNYAYKLKNLDFEYLRNEIHTLKIINSKIMSKANVTVPRLVHSEDKDKRISIITEYVDGKTIDNFSPKIIQRSLIDIIKYLDHQSDIISKSQLKKITKRNKIVILIKFPLNFAKIVLKEPASIQIFSKGLIIYFHYVFNYIFQNVKYVLSHRDLSVDNILYDPKKQQITIIDTECMILADKLRDLATFPRLYIRFLNSNQILSVFNSLNLTTNEFKRLILLMITSCINKIATEKRNSRDYIDAINGLNLSIKTLIPEIEKNL